MCIRDRYTHFFEDLEDEIRISQDIILRLNHWMYHHTEEHSPVNMQDSSCGTNIYSMLRHLTNSEKFKQMKPVTSEHEDLPSFITDIQFKDFLSDTQIDETHYLNLLSTWNFAALNLTTEELIICGFLLIRKLTRETGRKDLILDDNQLLFLFFTIEASYHQVNKFHNFRHAIDVMQATWQLCVNLKFKDPIHILLLCIAGIGHDIGHPGTNNQLFKESTSSLGEKFQNQSVLEKFHAEVFQNLIFHQWPQLFQLSHENSNLIKEAILATDMGFHTTYVKRLNELIQTPPTDKNPVDFITLISFVIKAADISNVTRPLIISAKWAFLIGMEFTDCGLSLIHI